ncbi:DNA circularization protein [Herbaspirillum frisingense]|uniref:Prophage DNA circulation protein n=1 Tax=Herbaspirillum frisingense TaxID=92645 RepID=A0ABU1PCZ9_9BURK|nr:DNA circularization N-terminal domain-containing protein [Herbaspirillum frisingense]MDR6583812.1 prophage DNA circulation protein [Herbaspirillum frisingense]
MAWRDNLRQASFRGVKFNVDSSGLSIGRRIARHEYPQRDIPYPEDMGRRAREYKVEAFVLGDPAGDNDYMVPRDALIEAIEKAGPGQLVHPYYGTVAVTVFGEVTLSESTREGGMAKFTITFLEAGKQEEPKTSDDTEAKLADQVNACDASFAKDFSDKFSVDGLPDFAVDDALGQVDDLMALPDVDLGALDWIRADPTSVLTSLLPENLRNSLDAPLSLAQGVLGLIGGAQKWLSFFNFSEGLAESASAVTATTASRIAVVNNQTAFSDLVRGGATSNRIYELATTQPATTVEAQALRSEIVQRADDILFSDKVSQATSQAVVQLRTVALQHLASNTVALPSLVSVTQQQVRPAVVLAHDFYGDAWYAQGRADDLVSRNSVAHPGFVPAGQPLQFVSE